MRLFAHSLNPFRRPRLTLKSRPSTYRSLLTVAIETSCDDTSVAVLEAKRNSLDDRLGATLHFHKKITSKNTSYQGVHPLISLYSHQENLAKLLDEALLHLPPKGPVKDTIANGEEITFPPSDAVGAAWTRKRPDFISVTRGPGMRSNLFTGLDTAKGLAVAMQIPLVGVHHMQAHALTPRLVAALQNFQHLNHAQAGALPESGQSTAPKVVPEFPFLSVLASGGHTLIVHSASLTGHRVLASTNDIAVGECLDKVARVVLPAELLQTAPSTMYGAVLEQFAFPEPLPLRADTTSPDPDREKLQKIPDVQCRLEDNTAQEYCDADGAQNKYGYVVPKNNEEALRRNRTRWGWILNSPLTKGAGGLKRESMEMSFSGLLTYVERIVQFDTDTSTGRLAKFERSVESISLEERRAIAREAMRAAFEHIATRVVLGLQKIALERPASSPVATVVMAGGVAANSYLRLASTLIAHGHSHIRILFPPASLCTDNAAMIAWAGVEMYAAGYRDRRSIRAIRKWPLDQLLSPSPED